MTAALAFNPDIPLPKFRKGQLVFHASEVDSVETLSCPDCLDTRKWKVISPAGTEYDAACQRCTGGRTDLPSLKITTWHPRVRALTIGSIRIDTADQTGGSWHREPISYMCVETGVGSGTVYYESQLFEHEDDAQKAAALKAASRTSDERKKPERVEQIKISYLTLKDATLDDCRRAVWDSWYRYRNLRENMEGFLEGHSSAEDLRSNIEQALDFDKRYRSGAHPLDALIEAAAKVDDGAVKASLAALPFGPIKAVEEPADEVF